MAYLPPRAPQPGTAIEIDVRGQARTAEVRAKPSTPRSLTVAEASYPSDLKYHAEHDWARIDGGRATLRHHLVRPGAARRGRLLRPAAVGDDADQGPAVREVESVKASRT
jgi:hypothetical protein